MLILVLDWSTGESFIAPFHLSLISLFVAGWLHALGDLFSAVYMENMV